MTDAQAQVIYCHCAFANVIPTAVKNQALRHILSSGQDFQAVPDLCQMAAEGDERLGQIAAGGATTVVACYPRAVKGLFDRAGYPIQLDDDHIRVLNMRELDGEQVVEELPPSSVETTAPPVGPEEVEARHRDLTAALEADSDDPDAWKPWFPVIDYDRCTNCGLCANFCIFGVYKIDEGKLTVDNPDHCKTDCPACARVCPETAIMFPKHEADSPINGSNKEADGDQAGVDMGQTLQGDVMGLLRSRSSRTKRRFAKRATDAEKLCACAAETGMLSQLGIPDEVLAQSAGDIQQAITSNPELVQLAANAFKQASAAKSEKTKAN